MAQKQCQRGEVPPDAEPNGQPVGPLHLFHSIELRVQLLECLDHEDLHALLKRKEGT